MSRKSPAKSADPSRARVDRRRRRRRVLGVALFALLGCVAIWVWRAADVERALDHAAHELATRTGLVLSHGAVHVRPGRRLGVEVHDVKLVDRPTGRTLFEASSLVVALELEALLHGEVRFGEIVVDHPRVRGERVADGTIDLVTAFDRVLAAAAASPRGDERPAASRRFVTRVAADQIAVRGARLEWLDQRHPDGPQLAVIEPLDATIVNRRRANTLEFEARGQVIQPRTPVMPAAGTRLEARASITGIGQVATLASAPIEVELSLTELDLALVTPWLQRSLGERTAIGGVLHAHGRFSGTLKGDLAVELDTRVANAAWTIPAAWSEPQTWAALAFRVRAARHGGSWVADDWALDGEDVQIRGRAVLDRLDSDDPRLSIDLETPWLDVSRVRHRLPLEAMGETLRYLARVVEHGRGRVVSGHLHGHLSQLARLGEPANREVLALRLAFEDVSGVPYPGLARASAVSGEVTVTSGNASLERFTGHYGDSQLGAIDGVVRDVWGATRLEFAARELDVALVDLAHFLKSDWLPRATREFVTDLTVLRGRARGRFQLATDFVHPTRFGGEVEIVEGAFDVPARRWSIAKLTGPVSFDQTQITSRALGLELGRGGVRARVKGSVTRYQDDPSLDIGLEARDVAVADLERALGTSLASGKHGGRVSGTLAIRGRPRRAEPLVLGGRFELAGVDVGPPFLSERIDDVTGAVMLEGSSGHFDLASLVWHDHRSRATGRFEGIGGDSPRVTVEGVALEPIDVEHFAGGTSDARSTAHDGARAPVSTSPSPRLTVVGSYRAQRARYRDTAIDGLDASFRYDAGVLELERATGRALGGSFDAHARFRTDPDGRLVVELEPILRGMDAPRLLATLDIPWRALTGRADVSGRVRFGWPPARQLDTLDGRLQLRLTDGRIFEATALWKVLDLVDFSRWITSPMGWREMGLAYDELAGELVLREARVSTRDLAMHGPTVDMELRGSIGLADRSVTGNVRVAPLQLVDDLLDPIPVLGEVKRALGLTKYAFRLSGTFGDVRVMPEPLERVDALWNRVAPERDGTDPREPAP